MQISHNERTQPAETRNDQTESGVAVLAMSQRNCDHAWSRMTTDARSPSSHTRRWFTNLQVECRLEANSTHLRLRNEQRSQNEMHEVIAWQRAAVGVAFREGVSQIANASVVSA